LKSGEKVGKVEAGEMLLIEAFGELETI